MVDPDLEVRSSGLSGEDGPTPPRYIGLHRLEKDKRARKAGRGGTASS